MTVNSNCNIFGGLYQWNEMMDYNSSDNGNPGIIQGVCPVGWHLPTDNEWIEMTDFLGGSSIAGGKLKETRTTHWIEPNTGATNESGFTALPGGVNCSNADFLGMDFSAFYWSTSEWIDMNSVAWSWLLQYNNSTLDRIVYASWGYIGKINGFSVRCLRDSDQFSYLTISDDNFNPVSDLNFYSNNNSKEIIIN